MNITLFYHKWSRYYFKRALASLLLGVLVSLLIPGLHILFYLLFIIVGVAFVIMYVIYNTEVYRSREALKENRMPTNEYLVMNKDEQSYCFFTYDGTLKSRVYFKGSSLALESVDNQLVLRVDRRLLEMSVQGMTRHFFNDSNALRNDSRKHAVFMKKGEGWELCIDEQKVCFITRGRLPLQMQQLFDPSSIVVVFEEVESGLKHWSLLYIVLLMEEYYVI
ncbi:hypothetical protein V1502_12790 [Bacillus sp. SCS-153A]|uniref:hypothetical protein n=1 Tax=Rossellomorea sedimentorum TaxID=3115294 RepID=UPI0039069B3F